jgi:predicted DNA-binding protein (UPF0251 family)
MPGRRKRARCIGFDPGFICFKPCGRPGRGMETLELEADELEALRLSDFEGLYQEECARRMGISRTTLSRTLVHARLGIGEDNSGKLVTLVRREARRLAEEQDADLIISDGPPGIGCPVTAAITGVDLVLAVTEPTPSGIHDLQRVAGVCGHFAIPLTVCINKYDINHGNSERYGPTRTSSATPPNPP